MLKIFLCEPIHPRALALLKTRAEVFSDPACLGRADAAISRNLRMDAAFLEQCPAAASMKQALPLMWARRGR